MSSTPLPSSTTAAGTPLHPVVQALELLTRAWNPPHRPPRPVRAVTDSAAFEFPLHTLHVPWVGSHLRGLRFAGLPDAQALSQCDLRGCESPGVLANDDRFDLRARLRTGLGQQAPLPSLAAPSRARWDGHWGTVQGLAFSPDGQRLATGGADGTVRVWSPQAGRLRELAVVHLGTPVRGVVFGDDGQTVAAVGDDGFLRTWRCAGTQLDKLAELDLGAGSLMSVAMARGVPLLACGSLDGRLRAGSLAAGTALLIQSEDTHPDPPVSGLAFSADGRFLAAAQGSRLRLLETRPPGLVDMRGPELRGGTVSSVCFGGRDLLAAAGQIDVEGALWLWHLEGSTLTELAVMRGQAQTAIDVAVSADGTQLASVAIDGIVRLWRVEGREVHETAQITTGLMLRLAFDPSGQRIATLGDDGRLQWWAVHRDGLRLVAQAGGDVPPLRCALMTGDGQHLVSADDGGRVSTWAVTPSGARVLAAVEAHDMAVTVVSASIDGNRVVTGDKAGMLRVHERQDGASRVIATHDQLQGSALLAAAFTPDDEQVVCVSQDGSVRSLPLRASNLRQLPARLLQTPPLRAAALSADARRLATIEENGTLQLHLLDEPSPSTFAHRDTAPHVSSVAFVGGARGEHLLLGKLDGSATLWTFQGAAREEVDLPARDAAPATSVAISPDARLLAVASATGRVRIWARQGDRWHVTADFDRHDGAVTSVAFAGDGLLTTGADGTLCLTTPAGELWRSIGRGLVVLERDGDDSAWTLMRADGQAFETVEQDGAILPADPLLYAWLWFGDPAWGHVPAFDVPPSWLEWSSDQRSLRVSRDTHSPDELRAWIEAAATGTAPPA